MGGFKKERGENISVVLTSLLQLVDRVYESNNGVNRLSNRGGAFFNQKIVADWCPIRRNTLHHA